MLFIINYEGHYQKKQLKGLKVGVRREGAEQGLLFLFINLMLYDFINSKPGKGRPG